MHLAASKAWGKILETLEILKSKKTKIMIMWNKEKGNYRLNKLHYNVLWCQAPLMLNATVAQLNIFTFSWWIAPIYNYSFEASQFTYAEVPAAVIVSVFTLKFLWW